MIAQRKDAVTMLRAGESPALVDVSQLDPHKQRAAGSLLGSKYCHDHLVLPIDVTQNHLTIAFPHDDPAFFNQVRDRSLKDLRIVTMDVKAIRDGLVSLWPQDENATDTRSRRNKFIDDSLLRGAELGASETVYQYESNGGYVRYCVNGIWIEDQVIEANEMERLVEATATEAFSPNWNREIEQRGRLARDLDGRDINVRISSYPRWFRKERLTISKLVMRMLGRWEHLPSFERIGMTEEQATTYLSHIMSRKAGIIVAAPTGEGKSTTIYSGIVHLNPRKGNMYAIEDPPEIEIPFVTHSAINEAAGWTYERAITATLRQKPTFLFVGESLDVDTARYAMRGMLQGIPSATSIHADDSVGAILRLLSLDVPVFQIQQGITMFISQRLINPVCSATGCAIEVPPSPEVFSRCQSVQLPVPTTVLRRSETGCQACFHTGLRLKQRAIFEVVPMTPALSKILDTTRNPQRIAQVAYAKHPPMLAFAYKLLRENVIDEKAFLEIPSPLTERVEALA